MQVLNVIFSVLCLCQLQIDCYSTSESEVSDAPQSTDLSTGMYHPSRDVHCCVAVQAVSSTTPYVTGSPTKTVDKEACGFVLCRFAVETVHMKFACIIIHNYLWLCWKTWREYGKWDLWWLAATHNFETITYPMNTVDGEDTRSKSRVTMVGYQEQDNRKTFSSRLRWYSYSSTCLLVSMAMD